MTLDPNFGHVDIEAFCQIDVREVLIGCLLSDSPPKFIIEMLQCWLYVCTRETINTLL